MKGSDVKQGDALGEWVTVQTGLLNAGAIREGATNELGMQPVSLITAFGLLTHGHRKVAVIIIKTPLTTRPLSSQQHESFG